MNIGVHKSEHRFFQFTFITGFFSGLYVMNRIVKKKKSLLQLMKHNIARTHYCLQQSVRIGMGSSHLSKKNPMKYHDNISLVTTSKEKHSDIKE